MVELLIKVVFAHIMGDFVLQSKKMIENIEEKRIASPSLYLHALIHIFLLLIVTSFRTNYLLPICILGISHLAIDICTKILLKNQVNSIRLLLLDQIAHFVTIILFVSYFFPIYIDSDWFLNSKWLLLLTAILLNTSVAPIVIRKIMEVLNYQVPNKGIKDAGKYIGILERLFVFFFAIATIWEGIGFLLAAKSIFRFGDLKENKDIKLTEYILIGTLISFGWAILSSQLYKWLMHIL